MVLKFFGLRTPLTLKKNIETPQSFCLCELSMSKLSKFIVFKIKTGFKRFYLVTHLKKTIINPLHGNINNIFYEK